ncbi:MAG: polyhydroxyalkanoate depolymerase [Alphaproteobacteria bacterium]|nr:polyhydroxyalkanoate depolymerase [Alphaproteobacteria bacterium]
MIYQAYQAQTDLMGPMRAFAQIAVDMLDGPFSSVFDRSALQPISAAYQMMARAKLSHARPAFDITSIRLGNADVPVSEEIVHQAAFGSLLRFRKHTDVKQPRVLLIAPLSGHYATLLRGTIKTLLSEHDVYVTDWHNARDIPVSEGRFGFDDYVDYIIRFLEVIGPGAHLIAVCQPCVQALVAASVMAEQNHPAQPRSMTLMAGPIDTRISPTKVNELACSKPMDWFERNLIAHVPARFAGAGRLVYPGFLQLSAFMGMNMSRHIQAHVEMFEHLARGDQAKADVKKAFYDEYFAVLDLTAEFYLETVRKVFQEHELPQGKLQWHGQTINPAAIRKTSLLTVEGERDDICAIGQTLAAHDLCKSIKPFRKRHHLQLGVGHYGVFSGQKWETQIYPLLRNTILASD